MKNTEDNNAGLAAAPGSAATPHKCPVCDGTGLVSRPPWVAGDVSEWTSVQLTHPCRPCGGAGIIWETSQQANDPELSLVGQLKAFKVIAEQLPPNARTEPR